MNITHNLPDGLAISGNITPAFATIVTPEALAFFVKLARKFEPTRQTLLAARVARQKEFDAGMLPGFLAETKHIRDGDWVVASVPQDIQDRRVEITGPTDRKMVINALNCGANTFMADFEDANCPTWHNMIDGQINLRDANLRTITFKQNNKSYQLNDNPAVLFPRPRGWHLDEKHVTLDGKPVSGGLFDFALYFFHNIKTLLARGSGVYLYLPKMSSRGAPQPSFNKPKSAQPAEAAARLPNSGNATGTVRGPNQPTRARTSTEGDDQTPTRQHKQLLQQEKRVTQEGRIQSPQHPVEKATKPVPHEKHEQPAEGRAHLEAR